MEFQIPLTAPQKASLADCMAKAKTSTSGIEAEKKKCTTPTERASAECLALAVTTMTDAEKLKCSTDNEPSHVKC